MDRRGGAAAVAPLEVDPETVRRLRRLDATNGAFGLVQVVLLPLIRSDPVLTLAVAGHVAVTVVSAAALLVRTD